MWFGNLSTSTKLQEFHYYQGKIQSMATVFFFPPQKQQQDKILITKKRFLYLVHRIHNGLQNHATLFGSGWIVNRIKHN